MRWLPVIVAAVAGCASAKVDNGNTDSSTGGDDANNGDDAKPIDAPAIDAPPDAPIPVQLSQTGSTNLVATAIGCQQGTTRFTRENSYYRTFPLSDFGITVPFHIVDVTFAVERSTPGGGAADQPATVRLGTYGAGLNATTFATASLTPLAAANIKIPANATSVTVPISMFTPNTLTLQPGVIMFVEIFVPDGVAAGNIFYIGSNNGTETHPSYIRAPATGCDIASPTQYATAVPNPPNPTIRLLLTVNGTH
jgi:hypothetical protein